MQFGRLFVSNSGFLASVAWTPLIAPLSNYVRQTSTLSGAKLAVANKAAILSSNWLLLANWLVKSPQILPSPLPLSGVYTPWPSPPGLPPLPVLLRLWYPPRIDD